MFDYGDRGGTMKIRWILALVGLAALAVAAVVWVATRDDPSSNSADVPIGSPRTNGDPKAQCKVLALAALEALAQKDISVLAQLEAGHDPSTHFIAQVVRSNQATFLAAAHRSTPVTARGELTPKITTDCANAPQ
jgi:hypothetical protein